VSDSLAAILLKASYTLGAVFFLHLFLSFLDLASSLSRVGEFPSGFCVSSIPQSRTPLIRDTFVIFFFPELDHFPKLALGSLQTG